MSGRRRRRRKGRGGGAWDLLELVGMLLDRTFLQLVRGLWWLVSAPVRVLMHLLD